MRTCIHILLENLVEIVRIAKSYAIGNLCHRKLGAHKKVHRVINAHRVDIVNGCFSYAVLEHLGEVIGRDTEHLCKAVYVYLLLEVLRDIVKHRLHTEHIVIDHTVALVLRAAVIAKECGHTEIDISWRMKSLAMYI